MKRWHKILVALIAILGAAYYWLFVDNRPGSEEAPLDIAAMRAAANSLAGDKPVQIEVETVTRRMIPEAMMVAGAGLGEYPLSVNAYRAGGVVIDTGLSKASDTLAPNGRDEAAYARVLAALLSAQAIVVTHEHLDHIGGVLESPNWAAVAPKALITREQFDHPENTKPVEWPKGSRETFRPHEYTGVKAIAPGVVVMKAPSHTPGSQIVFVELADGRGYLFTGDIASMERNHKEVRARSRLIGDVIISEDRPAVFRWLRAFNRVGRDHPEITIVPTHDKNAVEALVKAGKVQRGFK